MQQTEHVHYTVCIPYKIESMQQSFGSTCYLMFITHKYLKQQGGYCGDSVAHFRDDTVLWNTNKSFHEIFQDEEYMEP